MDAAEAQPDSWPMQQQLRERFVQDGRRFYFRDGRVAFRDHGRRLSTPAENLEAIPILMEVACSRGWQEIELEGTEAFRREAWRHARLAGLAVRGYKPSAAEHAAMIRSLSVERESGIPREPSVPPSALPAAPPASEHEADCQGSQVPQVVDEFIFGRLLAHGLDTHQFDPRQEMSYFVRIDTRNGQQTIWGKDLQRAIVHSVTQPKVGDEIAMCGTGPERIPDERRERRRKWRVEKRDFFDARARAAEALRDPDITVEEGLRQCQGLAGAYLSLHAAELCARDMPDSDDRRTFVQMVRSELADRISRGGPFPTVRLRHRLGGDSDLVREQPAMSR
jgi:hypothetical protein